MNEKRTAIDKEQAALDVGAAMETSAGRSVVAQQMIEPFRKGRDYVAIGRQVMYVDHLAQGAPSWWTKVMPRKLAICWNPVKLLVPQGDNPEDLSYVMTESAISRKEQSSIGMLFGETIKCLGCGAELKKLTCMHFKHHCSVKSVEEYVTKYPHAPLEAQASRSKRSRSAKKNWDTTECYAGMKDRLRGQAQKAADAKKVWFSSLSSVEKKAYLKPMLTAAKIGFRRWWDNLSDAEKEIHIDRFVRAGSAAQDSKRPTSIEKLVISFAVEGLEYVGDGKVWLTCNKAKKNPDFILTGKRKVVEVFGGYSHSEEVMGVVNEVHEQQVTALYKAAGFECLIVWEKDLLSNPEATKQRIVEFCYPQRLHANLDAKSIDEDIVRSATKVAEVSRNDLPLQLEVVVQ